MKDNNISRRRFIGTTALAAAGAALASKSGFAAGSLFQSKPNSVINGVQIGVITYSFRSMPGTIENLLQYCLQCNISAIELMGEPAEAFAGIPKRAADEDRDAWVKKVADWR